MRVQLATLLNIIQQANANFAFCTNHIFDAHGKKETPDLLVKQFSIIWKRALSNEWGRLASGNQF